MFRFFVDAAAVAVIYNKVINIGIFFRRFPGFLLCKRSLTVSELMCDKLPASMSNGLC